jgi:hypothetical protein
MARYTSHTRVSWGKVLDWLPMSSGVTYANCLVTYMVHVVNRMQQTGLWFVDLVITINEDSKTLFGFKIPRRVGLCGTDKLHHCHTT